MLPELGLPCLLPDSSYFGPVHKSAASHHPSAPTDPCVINAPFACGLERTPGTSGEEGKRLNWSREGEEERREEEVIPHCL